MWYLNLPHSPPPLTSQRWLIWGEIGLVFFWFRNYDFSLPAVRPRTGSTTPSPSLPRARSPTRCERLLRVHFVQGDRGLLLWQQVMGESEISKNRPGEQRGSVRGWSPWGIDGHIRWLNSVGHRKSLACRHSVTGPVWYPYLNAQCTALTKYRPKKHVNIFHNKTNMAWKLKNWSMKTEHSQVDIKKAHLAQSRHSDFFKKLSRNCHWFVWYLHQLDIKAENLLTQLLSDLNPNV